MTLRLAFFGLACLAYAGGVIAAQRSHRCWHFAEITAVVIVLGIACISAVVGKSFL